ncbi:hypothetical protein QQG91_09220 [Marivivens sp. LCG002]|uniref:hypothetical protein n=1 Tax=Marivivens sp. LCG002 TaxID=3051171 RepID=UPI0025564045|nr:hypothetical protein [Marivivens sp. LCG002]WIV49853.1 hypothetical protein QQG91_09220 [Marivivens sp. LCG002]
MTKLKLTSALFSFVMLTTPAFAQDFVEAKIQELFAQGYTHFEVSRGLFRTQIEAYGPNYTKLELQLSNSDGAIVSERAQIESETDYSQNVQNITQTQATVREEYRESDDDAFDANDDDDRTETRSEYQESNHADDDNGDDGHDRYEFSENSSSESDDHSFNTSSDDHYESSDNDHNDDGGHDESDDDNDDGDDDHGNDDHGNDDRGHDDDD